MRGKWRTVIALSASLLVTGGASAAMPALAQASVTHASAGASAGKVVLADPFEMCDGINGSGHCLNAWNGGPLVKAYTGGVGNDAFSWGGNGSQVQIWDSNTGMYVGDYLDNSQDAKAGLNSTAGAWGSYFTAYSCGVNQGVSFHNNHWNAWLSGGDSDGDQFYLNVSDSKCYYSNSF